VSSPSCRHARAAFRSTAVERDELVAALEAQNVPEVVRLALVEQQTLPRELAVYEQSRYAAFRGGHHRFWLDPQ
jgi:hypothetical protein